jgi:hypothetical protein
MLEHYRENGYKSENVNVGTISAIDNKPFISWNSLDSWEGLMG